MSLERSDAAVGGAASVGRQVERGPDVGGERVEAFAGGGARRGHVLVGRVGR